MRKLSSRDKQHIKKLFDQRLASIDEHFRDRVTTPVDFDDDGACPGFALQKFREVTGSTISGSTLERLLGLQRGSSNPQIGTLTQLLTFLNFNTPEELYNYLNKQRKLASKNKQIPFSLNNLLEDHYLNIVFESSKAITIKHYIHSSFIVISSRNTKFSKNDIINVFQLSIGKGLLCSDVKRRTENNQYIELGGYNSGSEDRVSKIEIVQPSLD